jgi:hypothetical protein
MASNGNSILPAAFLRSTPAASRACTSPGTGLDLAQALADYVETCV